MLVLTQGQIEHMVPVADVRPATPPQGPVNLLRLLFGLFGTAVSPARGDHHTDETSYNPEPSPCVPRQARRHLGDQSADSLARDHPHWRVVVLPGRTGVWVVAAFGPHLVRASSIEAARHRIHEIEAASPHPACTYVHERTRPMPEDKSLVLRPGTPNPVAPRTHDHRH